MIDNLLFLYEALKRTPSFYTKSESVKEGLCSFNGLLYQDTRRFVVVAISCS